MTDPTYSRISLLLSTDPASRLLLLSLGASLPACLPLAPVSVLGFGLDYRASLGRTDRFVFLLACSGWTAFFSFSWDGWMGAGMVKWNELN